MISYKNIFSLTILVFMYGCTSISPHDKYVNEEHITNNVTTGEVGYFKEYDDSYKSSTSPGLAQAYLDKGIALSRTVCFDYLDLLSTGDNTLQFSKNEFGVLAVLATGIMGLNGVSANSFSKLALGAAAIDATTNLYINHYLLGPDSDLIIEMVKTAMNTAESEINNRSPETFVDAYVLLESYSRLCSATHIRRLTRESIQQAKFVASEPLQNLVAQNVTNEIAALFNRSGLSDSQMFGLYWKVTEDPKNPNYTDIIGPALGDLKAEIDKLDITALQDIKKKFNRIPAMTTKYRKLIAKAKLDIQDVTNNGTNEQKLAKVLSKHLNVDEKLTLVKLKSLNGNQAKLKYSLEMLNNDILRQILALSLRLEPVGGLQINVK